MLSKACIANTLVVDCGEAARAGLKGLHNAQVIDLLFSVLMRLNPAARWGFQHAQWTLGIRKPHEWPDAYAPFTLKGLESHFRNPMLFLFSEDDIMDAAASTSAIVVGLLDFILSLPCERSVHLFQRREGASSHCQMGGLSYAHTVIFDWLDQILCAKACHVPSDPAAPQAFVDIFKKYGGEKSARGAPTCSAHLTRPVDERCGDFYPDLLSVSSFNAVLVRGGDRDRSLSSAPGCACRHFRARALRPASVRTLRPH